MMNRTKKEPIDNEIYEVNFNKANDYGGEADRCVDDFSYEYRYSFPGSL
jgi:hypothetical protein